MLEQIPEYMVYGGGMLLAYEQIISPIIESLSLASIYNNKTRPSSFKEEGIRGSLRVPVGEIKKYENKLTDPKLDALDFLNVACGLTHNKKEVDGVCRHYADTVYEVFHELIKLNDRDNLKNDVDICENMMKNCKAGHAFLRAKTKKGNKIYYETFGDKVPLLEPEEVSNFSTENFDKVQELNLDEKPNIIYNTEWGVAYPTLKRFTQIPFLDIIQDISFTGSMIYKKLRNLS